MTRTPSRRAFLGAGLAAPFVPAVLEPASAARPGAAAVVPAREPLHLLILGGTSFLGPAIVEYALARGHQVTLFNRGKTNADLFPQCERLRGDRDEGELDALKGRAFDAAIDTSGYVPAHVRDAARVLEGNVGHYSFVSSISVYEDFGSSNAAVDESSPVATVGDDIVAKATKIRESFPHYGAMKALCEQAAVEVLPGKVANIRPGLIVGPRDPTDRFGWWPARVDRGGAVLAPGDPDALVQVIDVRDLGAWIVQCAEQRTTGVFNACGFDGKLRMDELLHGCKCATSTPVDFRWVSEEFLAEHGVEPWTEMPLWIPREGRGYVHNRKAIAAGLAFRPVADTIRATLAWIGNHRGDRPWRSGILLEKEQAVLAAWRERRKG